MVQLGANQDGAAKRVDMAPPTAEQETHAHEDGQMPTRNPAQLYEEPLQQRGDRPVFALLFGLSTPAKGDYAAFLAFFLYTIWIHFNFISFESMAIGMPTASTVSYATSVYANGAALLLFAFLHARYEKVAFDTGVVVASVFLCALGTLLAMTSGLFLVQTAVLDFAAGILSGFGSAMLLMMLALLLVGNGRYSAPAFFAFLTANLASVPLAALPPAVLLVLVTVMPLGSIACTLVARRSSPANALPNPDPSNVRAMAPLIVRALIFVFIIYAGISVSNSFAQSNGASPDQLAQLLVTVFVVLLVGASSHAEGKRLNVLTVYRTVFFCALLGLFSVPFFDGNFNVSYGIIAVLVTVVRAFIFILEYRICVKTNFSPVLVFGIGETIKKVPGAIVRFVMGFTDLQIYSDPNNYIKLYIVLGLLIAIVYVLVFTEKHLLLLSKDDLTIGAEELIARDRMAVAHGFGLTERETEIFLHLCDGRSAPWIAQEIYISQATVNVHIKNIYRKCDVHSRQELLDLVSN